MGNETSSESGVVEEVEQGQEESSVISPSAPGASTHYAGPFSSSVVPVLFVQVVS